MEARIITNRQQWNEFVAGAEQQCNVTQSYEWGQLLKTLDGEVLYVGVLDDGGKMCAAMLLLVSRVAVSNSVYFYAPRGPIIDDPDSPAMTVLLNYVKALAHKQHAFMLKIEPGVPDNDPQWLSALHRRGFVANPEALHLRHEWVLDIRPDEQTLLADMKKTWRYCIRLAGRKDVTVRRGESPADIDTFYHILQTTSQRDTFMIYDKSFYEKLVELYGQSQNVALFIAEYEGQALGAALLVKMGRWCWYMYGASSNEHRDRMPNHLLQWTAMRWAKEQGCWYYNFRGIPDVLEESQPMWGVYLFKSGFGGYPMRSLETHDLPYNPLLYRLYRSWLDGRGWLKDVRARRHNKQFEADKLEKTEQQEKQSKQAESLPKATATRADAEPKPAGQREQTAEKQPKQPRQPKQFRKPQEPLPSTLTQPSQAEQQSTPSQDTLEVAPQEVDIFNPTPQDAIAEAPQDADISNPTPQDVLDQTPRDLDASNLIQQDASKQAPQDASEQVSQDLDTSNLTHQDTFDQAPRDADIFDVRGADLSRTNPIYGEGITNHPTPLESSQEGAAHPIALESSQEGAAPTTRGTTEEILQQIIGSTEDKSASPDWSHTEPTDAEGNTQVPTQPTYSQIQNEQQIWEQPAQTTHESKSADFEAQMQPIIEQRDEVQPATIEDPIEHLETKDEPVEIQSPQPGSENLDEHKETRDENIPGEPIAQPYTDRPAQEELESQEDAFNEVTQKLPRIQMAQKYGGTGKPAERDGMNGA